MTDTQDLGVVHHTAIEKGDISATETAVEEAKAAVRAENDRHEQAGLKIKQDAAKKIQAIKDELVAAERKEAQLHEENADELANKVKVARSHQERAAADDLEAATQKARAEAGNLGYKTVRFNGETPKAWSFVYTDRDVKE